MRAMGSVRAHRMPFGAQMESDGRVRFRIWAPAVDQMRIEIAGVEDPLTMERQPLGWHELVTDRARHGTSYRYRLPNDLRVPDPASRHQPVDVHGPSAVIDAGAYRWRDADWRGRPWEEAVLYELHLGTFTPEGTFAGAARKLDHLVELGVTAVQIMPVAEFAGSRNWGYDGVLPFAPDHSYGTPTDFKDFVQAAHGHGLMVMLDVVYNHFGPEGNYLHAYAPQFFTESHHTPWGAAVNFDGKEARPVREYFIHNTLYWIEEFHLDGLRFDAVDHIVDDSPKHFLDELAERVRTEFPEHRVHLVLENGMNEAHRLARDEQKRPRWYNAQWNDDVHHVLHVATTGESGGYYVDFAGDSRKLARSVAEGFAFQGEHAEFWQRTRGEPSADLPPSAFVSFIQNHDQVGNRPFGERLHHIAPEAAVRAAAATYLLAPQIPMLFMGEEWAAAQPFQFFADFAGDLADAVRNGRRNEFARFPEFAKPENREKIPDPLDAATFARSCLGWRDISEPQHAAWLDWYKRILAVRRAVIVPLLPRIHRGGTFDHKDDGVFTVEWAVEGTGTLHFAANFANGTAAVLPPPAGNVLWQEGVTADGSFTAPAVRWSLGSV